jgi:Holliday junction resolvase
VALTPERKVKQQVVALLKEAGAYYFFPSANGLGRSGIPDIIVCYRGRFVGIECKAGKGQTTALQERELKRISEAGGTALVIREDDIALVTSTLNLLRALHDTETSTCFRSAGDSCFAGED